MVAAPSPTAEVNGRSYRGVAHPLHEVGSLLDAGAVHGGRTAWQHLLSVAQSNGIGKSRTAEMITLAGLDEVKNKKIGGFSLGMKQRLGIATALLGDPPVLIFDEPVNGLDPEGVQWIRELFKAFAAEGRTVFVSSHLMSEMALTADRLIIIGRGRLLADTTVDELTQASRSDVLVRSPRAQELSGLLSAKGATVAAASGAPDTLTVTGMDAGAIGDIALRNGIAVHELTPRHASLEEGLHEDHGRQRPVPRRGPPMMVLLSEWTKLRALRSTYVTLLVAAVTALLATGIVAASTAMVRASQAPPFGAVAGIFAGWLSYPSLAVGVLGIITMTAEYSTGQIRLTFTAVPRRLSVLAAKAAVTGLTGLVLGEVLAFAGYGLTAAAFAGHPLAGTLSGASIHVLAGGLSLCAVILLGLGIGTICRRTAGAIVTLPAVLYLPLLVFVLPAQWKDDIGRFTLVGAVYQLVSTHPSGQLFSPGLSLIVMLAWPALALAVAAVVITRHDA